MEEVAFLSLCLLARFDSAPRRRSDNTHHGSINTRRVHDFAAVLQPRAWQRRVGAGVAALSVVGSAEPEARRKFCRKRRCRVALELWKAVARNVFLSKAHARGAWAGMVSAPVARARPRFAAGIIVIGVARRVAANLRRVMFDDELLVHHVNIDERTLAALVPIRLYTAVARLHDVILHPKEYIPRGVSTILVRDVHEIQWAQGIEGGVHCIGRMRVVRSDRNANG